MTTFLLDANVLIALTVREHEHHERAVAWAEQTDSFAICPVVEGALLRFLVRMGESVSSAAAVLAAIRSTPHCDFWPDSLSYGEAEISHVRGHRQLTDAYLASLAASHGEFLATFDEGIAEALPAAVRLVR